MKILLTGFGPFPGVPVNPSGHVVEQFPADCLPGHTVVKEVLPTAYRKCRSWLARALTTDRWDVVVHLGVHRRARLFHPETTARNVCTTTAPDADGDCAAAATILAEAPDVLPATLPIESVCRSSEAAGLPVSASDDAGDYLCNFLYYHSLAVQARGRAARSCFLHIPFVSELPGCPPEAGCPLDLHLAVLERLLREAR